MSYAWVRKDEDQGYLLIIHDTVVVGHVEWDETQQQYQAVYRGWQVGYSADQGEVKSMVEEAENKLRSADRGTVRRTWLVTFGEGDQQAVHRLHIEAESVIRIGASLLVAYGVRVELDKDINAVEKLAG